MNLYTKAELIRTLLNSGDTDGSWRKDKDIVKMVNGLVSDNGRSAQGTSYQGTSLPDLPKKGKRRSSRRRKGKSLDKGPVNCAICGRKFEFQRALNGHMSWCGKSRGPRPPMSARLVRELVED